MNGGPRGRASRPARGPALAAALAAARPLALSVALGAALPILSAARAAPPASPPAPADALPPTAEAGPDGPGADAEGWTRIGVVVASRRGLSDDKPLRFAYDDGAKLERLLATVGQVEPENLFYLRVERGDSLLAGAARAGRRIEALKRSGRKVFLQFYYTGHGAARNFHLEDGPFAFDAVKEALGGRRADARVYVLDVCYGASFFTAKGFRTAPPVQLRMEMDKSARGEATISSSSLDEQAYEVRTLGGSIFTSHWIMALRGAGDRNRDGQVTLFEAYNYAYDRTAGYSAETLARPQHPAFQFDLTGARDVMLARLLGSSTGLLFRRCPAGKYHVLDMGRGHAIGELRVPDGEEFTLALEPGRYRVQYLPPRGSVLSADVDLSAAGMTPLAFAAFGPAPTQEAGRKGAAGPVPGPPPADASPGPMAARWRLGTGFALAAFRDPVFAEAFRARSPVDRYFGLDGGSGTASLRRGWSVDVAYSLPPWPRTWLGARFETGQVRHSLHASGLEPLASLPDTARAAWPVHLAWNGDVRDITVLLYAGRHFPIGPSQALSLDLGGGRLWRSGEGKRVLERTLYQSRAVATRSLEAEGYRLEAGIGYGVQVASGPGLRWGLGLRLAPYFQAATARNSEPGLPALDSRETGASLSLTLSLGRSRPASRSLP